MERRSIAIQGIVQGVGFRPFVHGLASRLRLGGSVKNQNGTVLIEVEGDGQSLDAFLKQLTASPPPLARIARLDWKSQPVRGESRFRIESSDRTSGSTVFIAPDVATCAACLAEMGNPKDRRYRYPFLNCTHCGPRLTIIQGAPYDRERTTMASFPLCPACRAEYEDPANRRFHAQPTACAVCGPRLAALDATGQRIAADDPLAHFVASLRQGRIGAMKGLGGYHLVCDATQDNVVQELRRRKHRDEKPFALMLADIASVEALCDVSDAERELLQSPARPIVLLKQKTEGQAQTRRQGDKETRRSAGDASFSLSPCLLVSLSGLLVSLSGPALSSVLLGVMLPYTPLHHLLMKAVAGLPLVMTSGNRSDEPIAYDDADAVQRLAGIADVFLVHNRPIHVRCEDSVTRVIDGVELPIRRSRGYVPQPVTLPFACARPILAVGGQFKGTFALGRDRHAFLSHHLGDLDHLDAYRAFERDIALYEQLFEITPEVIAHDLHPDYASTQYALKRVASGQWPVANEDTIAPLAIDYRPLTTGHWPLAPVQHHHAHLASCMAENGLTEPVIGVIFDGTGYGLDGAIWGGEFLVGDYRQFQRLAHFRCVGLPGSSQAIREPWRLALAHLDDAGAAEPGLEQRIRRVEWSLVKQLLNKRFNTPWTSSAGRLFDAVASLAGVRDRVSFEGQAAMELEWLATQVSSDGAYPFELTDTQSASPATALIVDTRPLIRAVAQDVHNGTSAPVIARRFHTTMVDMIAAVCARLRKATGLERVVLSGGVFMNALLTSETMARLGRDGFTVHRHRLVPPNDGGLSLGQLAVAAFFQLAA